MLHSSCRSLLKWVLLAPGGRVSAAGLGDLIAWVAGPLQDLHTRDAGMVNLRTSLKADLAKSLQGLAERHLRAAYGAVKALSLFVADGTLVPFQVGMDGDSAPYSPEFKILKEIMADLEQAPYSKCLGFTTSLKVIRAAGLEEFASLQVGMCLLVPRCSAISAFLQQARQALCAGILQVHWGQIFSTC